uniref:Chitin-binding type-2 domain-containing protein n=1 Tax=Stomoxys calcitrans TaxID=35570 RepID=A0A1I8NQ39_STOCA
MRIKHLLASVTVLVVLTAHGASATYNVSEYCQLVTPGTKLPSLDSCQTYYTCQSGGGYIPSACSGTENFDKNSQSCKASSNSVCNIGLDNPCSNVKTEGWVTNPNDCTGWIYCKNGATAGSGPCPNDQMFSYSKQQCIYGKCTNNNQGGDVQIENLCEIMPNYVYFGDFEDCSAWHTCTPELQNGNCKIGLVYNTMRGMCLIDDGNMCNRIVNPDGPPTTPCTSTNSGKSVGDTMICSVYYVCNGTTWVRNSCSTIGQYYDAPSGTCMNRQFAIPEGPCNRCQYAGGKWVNAVDSDCQEYLTCNSDGGVAATGSCTTGQFFNEARQACLSITTNDLPSYKMNNGACGKAPCTTTTPGDDGTTESDTT